MSMSDSPSRFIEIFRMIWGAMLLTAPRVVLRSIHRVEVDQKAVVIARILGARHLAQASLSGIRPSPEIIAAGIWVDSVHALTALGLAALDRRRARGALTDAFVAALWALSGAHDLASGGTPPPHRQRLRDRLAQLILPRLPGGRPLLDRAQRANGQSRDIARVVA
ncbi:hypothetical protein [Mycobacterium asiaticum]|nr:hypothetical protein [Mycobacterium asiaticum]